MLPAHARVTIPYASKYNWWSNPSSLVCASSGFSSRTSGALSRTTSERTRRAYQSSAGVPQSDTAIVDTGVLKRKSGLGFRVEQMPKYKATETAAE